MDPPSARLALKLQLEDVDAILKSLPTSSTDAKVVSEIAAFRSLRNELVKKWQEVTGQCFAYNVLREENMNRVAFKRLLSEEQQAERDHDMACRLAGKPVPQRAPLFNTGNEAERAGSAAKATLNGAAEGLNKSRADAAGTQTTSALSKQPFTVSKPLHPSTSGKRTAEEQLTRSSDQTAAPSQVATGKRTRVDDETEEDKLAEVAALESAKTKKRVAFLDPAVLREDDDRTKRTKLDERKDDQPTGLDNASKGTSSTAAVSTASTGVSGPSTPVMATCSSCLDQHAKRDMLELSCSDESNTERHAYCRECLVRLFESSVTDPSHFPPRCCSKIIPFFKCIQFLPAPLFARFIARREELGTPNRTYCSNNQCSKWVRPANIEANVATCAECSQKTCTTCKAKQHEGLCQEDKDVKELMSVARQKRWQMCPSCKEMVELERGCYHIT
ncbi:hypothetical protein FB567DRAFT_565247 [Paraphoma chrysanthemicola]|uniref:RBR-type E3 ubiquitin transferase n=1 Tax=Paraphoma chrysanthemicola TaxID=798071 RepID=A0A8K0QT00_9PLEO|nr:hypothetical protein FB567DRAFT_565247 [Paraphoma chrysanthemicola]